MVPKIVAITALNEGFALEVEDCNEAGHGSDEKERAAIVVSPGGPTEFVHTRMRGVSSARCPWNPSYADLERPPPD